MLAHCKELLEYQNGFMTIHPRFNKLITVLRTAVENGESALDKEATSHDDLFDSFSNVSAVPALSLMVTLLFYQYKH